MSDEAASLEKGGTRMITKPAKVFQPSHFNSFRCIGSACEDTCCIGWTVHIDKATYDKYQACPDPHLAPSLHTLININDKSSGDDDYAKIDLTGVACPFLSEGICAIQQRLGEEYLSDMCATYPRVMNKVDDVLQRSLDLSCPEAARVVLLNPEPIEFEDEAYTDGSIRLGNIPQLNISSLKTSPEPYRFFRDIRGIVVSLLQDRSYPIWKRLFLVGRVCEDLDEAGRQGWARDSLDVIRKNLHSLRNGALADLLAKCPSDPKVQMETAVELILARISSAPVPRRFLDCYREFMDGIEWTSTSTMHEMVSGYAEAFAQYYAPFIARYEYMLEHYLVNYVHRTLFPFGVLESKYTLCDDRAPSSIAARYMLMAAYYAILQTLLIGSAGFHKWAFGAGQTLKAIQSCAKTFEHSVTYPGRVIEMLAEKSMTGPAGLCVLFRN